VNIVTHQPVNTRTIAPSSESFDHSGNEEFYAGRGSHSGDKQKKNSKTSSYSGGTIPAESLQAYAALAGIMDAISHIQTQESFLALAQDAVHKLKSCNTDEPKIGLTPDENHEYSKLTTHALKLLNRTNSDRFHPNTESGPKTGIGTPNLKRSEDNKQTSKTPKRINLDQSLGEIKKQQKRLSEEKNHLQTQAKSVRLNIEKFNKTDELMFNGVIDDQESISELMGTSNLTIETQALHLPKRAVDLINN